MATLTPEMKEMIGAQLNFLATADKDGNPQVGPKGTMRVFDDNRLIYNEETGRHAWANLQASGKAAVASVDKAKMKGFRFEGNVEIHKDDKIFDDAQAFAKEKGLPAAIAAVIINVTKIVKLDAGPNAGTIIEEDK